MRLPQACCREAAVACEAFTSRSVSEASAEKSALAVITPPRIGKQEYSRKHHSKGFGHKAFANTVHDVVPP